MHKCPSGKLYNWVALKSVPGIGNVLFKKLLERFSSPEKVFEASVPELKGVDGISEKLAAKIKKTQDPGPSRREIERVFKKGYEIVTYTDEDYPPLLRHIPDPPPFLYVSGRLSSRAENIGVVGSRNPTGYGVSNAKKLSKDLVSLGFTVVSGMARGIDSSAHEGALSGGGNTVAVLGSGLERIYPPENRRLFSEISESGAVISEFSLQSAPEAHHFPARNRIISGMSLGVVVVEAAKKSGSLITARLAAEQNRDVFAVPGSIKSFKSLGTHNLIKQGAKLVENANDILEELIPQISRRLEPVEHDVYDDCTAKKSFELSADEKNLLRLLEPYPIHIDELINKSALDPGLTSRLLLKLELEDLVEQLPGKHFCLKNRAGQLKY